MPNRRLTRIAIVVAILQTILALGGCMVYVIAIAWMVPGFDIDYEKPTHHVSLAQQILVPTIVFGPFLLPLILAAVLSWRQTRLGWWLSLVIDILAASLGAGFLIREDLPALSELSKHPALYSDVFYHLSLFLIPLVALALLFTRSMRAPGGMDQRA